MEKVHPQLFKGANRKFKKPKAHLIAIERHNKTKPLEKHEQSIKRMKKRKAKSLSKLKQMDIDFEYPGLVSVLGCAVIKCIMISWNLAILSSGNGLLPERTKPFPKPML